MSLVPTSTVPVATPQSSGAKAFSTSTPSVPQALSSEALAINNSNASPAEQQKAFAALGAKGGTYSPTVMTDSNIRETVIPDVKNTANTNLNQGTPTGESKDNIGNSFEDAYTKAFESKSVQSIGTTPEDKTWLQSIKDMQAKSDASTAAQLEGIHAGFQAREALLKESQESTNGLLRGLLMTDGSYRTGSGVSLISAKERADIQGLTNLANEELSAKAAIYKAKQESDFQLMDKANQVYEKIQEKRQALATKMADSIIQKNKDDRAYNLEVEKFNHEVDRDKIQNANELKKIEQGDTEFRNKYDELGNIIGTEVFSKAHPNKPISYIAEPGRPGMDYKNNTITNGTSAAGFNTDGSVNKKEQDAYLNTLPAAYRETVRALTEYRAKPPNMTSQAGQKLTTWAYNADPSFDATRYQERQKFINTWGAVNGPRNSLNTAVKHLGELKKASDNLGDAFSNNGGFLSKTYNNLNAWLLDHKQDPRAITFEEAANKVADELAVAYKGGSASATDVGQEKERILLSIKSSPFAKDAAITTATNLLGDKVQTLDEMYSGTMGKKAVAGDSVLFPGAVNSLKTMKASGLDINLSTYGIKSDLANNILMAQQSGHSSQDIVTKIASTYPEYSSKIQEALNQGINYDDILNYLNK